MFVDFNILNQLGSPAINSNTFANRPAAGQTGRLFVSIDTFEIYRDNGTTWDLIGGPGSSTITGTGTATQVAYFTSSQAIGSSANLFWDNTNTRLGIGTATPGVTLDIHSTGIMAHFNTTSATGNSYLAFQRTGTNVWRLGDQYNAGANFFQIHNTALSNNAVQIDAATNKTTWQAVQTYTTGLARANYLDYNLSVAAGGSFSSPNAITALGASLDLTLAGSATIPSGARSGLDAYNSIGFTGAGTLTHNQGAQIRAYSNVTAGWAFNGSATGTVTHLAGLRALFPDNTGSAINVTNNYALLLNDQTPNTGTVTYTNRWGVYQEGASDLNYFAANTLIGSTTNSGEKLQITGNAKITGLSSGQLLIVNGNGNSNTTISVTNTDSNSGAGAGYSLSSDIAICDLIATSSTNTTGALGGRSNAFAIRTNSASTGGIALLARNSASGVITFHTGGNTEKMRLDVAGNLGLSVTPSAWSSVFKVLESGNTNNQSAIAFQNSANVIYLTTNSYFDGSWKYKFSDNAGQYLIDGSEHRWYNAPSGTAGNAITFTQAMTLDASGRLGLGTSSPSVLLHLAKASAANQLWLQSTTGTNPAYMNFINSGGNNFIGVDNSTGTALFVTGGAAYGFSMVTESAYPLVFGTNNTERMRITSGGNILVGTTTDGGQKLQVNGNVNIGDIAGTGNGTKININDSQQRVAITATNVNFQNISTAGSAGALAGYMVVEISGDPYLIPYYEL